ncbi:MAG: NAD+ synthase [Rhodospirillales bacterium]
MTQTLDIALAQLNPTVGDVANNIDKVRRARAEASAADLLVCGELFVAGYPPEDLVLKRSFQAYVAAQVTDLARETADGGPAVLLGAPWRVDGRLYNAALLLEDGRIAETRLKYDLPNYGVFDEKRVFSAGPLPEPIPFKGVPLGVMICEDMWKPAVAAHLKKQGAKMLVVINGSPFEVDKTHMRERYAQNRVSETGLPLMYVNLVGGQDELVFDGSSFVMDAEGAVGVRVPAWDEAVVSGRWQENGAWRCGTVTATPALERVENIYRAMVMGLRDYVDKNYFPGVLIGLSGGVDSALSAAVAVDALGADRVHCVMMPSPYTSRESLEDAAAAAGLLGVQLDTISIEPAMQAFDTMLREVFVGHEKDTTEENVQARSRGITLMAISNKLGYMVLSTGNKSEMSVGYATLYGDMCGGYSVLKDIYKTTVYNVSRWRNDHRPAGLKGPEGRVIPERILTKAPSAELKPDQTDQDSLPPYDELDAILHCLIEEDMALRDIVAAGHDAAIVERVWRMLDRAEYKRRQAPPGVKITARAFGRDRRYPITNGFTGKA